jgi:hypothetical protein
MMYHPEIKLSLRPRGPQETGRLATSSWTWRILSAQLKISWLKKSHCVSSWKAPQKTPTTQPGAHSTVMKTWKIEDVKRGEENDQQTLIQINFRRFICNDNINNSLAYTFILNVSFSEKFYNKFGQIPNSTKKVISFIFGRIPKISDKFQRVFRTT